MGNKSLRFKILEDPKAFEILKADWESLCNELADNITVFASCIWYQNWWKYFSGDAKLKLFTMWQEDKLVGIAPLMMEKSSFHGLPVKVIGFIQNNQSLHNDFIVMPQFRTIFLQKLIQSLFSLSSNWDALYFRNISSISDNYKVLVQVLDDEHRRWKKKKTPFDTPYLIPSGGWSDYFAGRSRRTRKTLKHIRNKVLKAGEISVKHITTLEEFLACKEELYGVAQNSWTENVGGSLASPANKNFYESLASSAAPKDWLSIWGLYVNSKMIALEFHLRAFGKEHALIGHYNPEFSSFSPGTFLEMTILEHIFEEQDGIKVYDFCGAFDAYKKKWTDTFVPHSDIYIFKEQILSRYIKFQEFTLIPFLKRMLQRLNLLDKV